MRTGLAAAAAAPAPLLLGTDSPPDGNRPNRSGRDPQEHPRATPGARVQKSEFLKVGGQVVDVCGGAPCHAVP